MNPHGKRNLAAGEVTPRCFETNGLTGSIVNADKEILSY